MSNVSGTAAAVCLADLPCARKAQTPSDGGTFWGSRSGRHRKFQRCRFVGQVVCGGVVLLHAVGPGSGCRQPSASPPDGSTNGDPGSGGLQASCGLASSKASVSSVRPGRPVPAAEGLTEEGVLQPRTHDRCPVCAMRITADKKLASAIELQDRTTYYFCGTSCLLKTWLHPESLLGVPRSEIRRVVTRNYFTGQPLDAFQALWIAGSDVVGPMGPSIVPVADADAAQTFRRRHGAQHEFRLQELTTELWQGIQSRSRVR
ncbi:nitrous oxide reductase accessory protein NosL [Myxococcota bacterium]